MGFKGQWLETQEAGMGCDLLFPIPSEVIWNSFNYNQRIAIFVDIRTTLWLLQLSHFARYVNPLLVTYLVTVIQRLPPPPTSLIYTTELQMLVP